MSEKACDGGRVLEFCDMAECADCGRRVRWDLRDDRFWGFQNCSEKSPAVDTEEEKTKRVERLHRPTL